MKFIFCFILITVGASRAYQLPPIEIHIENPPPGNDDVKYKSIPTPFGQMFSLNALELGSDEALDVVELQNAIYNNVHFELFTAKNPEEPQIISHLDEATLHSSHFNPKLPTRIFIHGWYALDNLSSRFAEAYFKNANHKLNFIAVNWRQLSNVVNYVSARRQVDRMGPYVAEFVDFIVKTYKLNLKDFVIIGHSLGAHIAGIAGKNVVTGTIGQIVGLDPAAPLFKFDEADRRLADTDAEYVEVMHTSAGVLGFSQPLGNASFYPNGGKSQPGCGLNLGGACSHSRANDYYIESIYKMSAFFAYECDSFVNLQNGKCTVVNEIMQMGGEPNFQRKNGIFYLETNDKPMYSLGKRGIFSRAIFPVDGEQPKSGWRKSWWHFKRRC